MRLILLLALTAAFASAHAYDPERARNNLAHDAAECAAYFLLASSATGLDVATEEGLQVRAENLLELSLTATSVELTRARVSLAIETMKREMGKNWSNFSIINSKYGYRCLDLSSNPEAHARYWLDKKD